MNAIKILVKRIANKLGLEIQRIPKINKFLEYQRVMPSATYSPWNSALRPFPVPFRLTIRTQEKATSGYTTAW